mgnify:CR=1 FL=1
MTSLWNVRNLLDLDISRRLTVLEFKQRSPETIEKYLVDKFNPAVVKSSEKKFNHKNVQVLLNTTSFYWNVLNSYKLQMDEAQSVVGMSVDSCNVLSYNKFFCLEFCKGYIHSLASMLKGRVEERKIYEVMAEMMWKPQTKRYINQGVPYSSIKTRLEEDDHLGAKLKLATNDGILKIGHGNVSFANTAIFNAAVKLIK